MDKEKIREAVKLISKAKSSYYVIEFPHDVLDILRELAEDVLSGRICENKNFSDCNDRNCGKCSACKNKKGTLGLVEPMPKRKITELLEDVAKQHLAKATTDRLLNYNVYNRQAEALVGKVGQKEVAR